MVAGVVGSIDSDLTVGSVHAQVRIGELQLVAGGRGGTIKHDDRETRKMMKRKLLRRRNWCEVRHQARVPQMSPHYFFPQITQLPPDPSSREVGNKSVLEFALHVERLRELRHMLSLKGRGSHLDLAEIDADTNVPATNVWAARVVALEAKPGGQRQ